MFQLGCWPLLHICLHFQVYKLVTDICYRFVWSACLYPDSLSGPRDVTRLHQLQRKPQHLQVSDCESTGAYLPKARLNISLGFKKSFDTFTSMKLKIWHSVGYFTTPSIPFTGTLPYIHRGPYPQMPFLDHMSLDLNNLLAAPLIDILPPPPLQLIN